jgi:hypothetical protein
MRQNRSQYWSPQAKVSSVHIDNEQVRLLFHATEILPITGSDAPHRKQLALEVRPGVPYLRYLLRGRLRSVWLPVGQRFLLKTRLRSPTLMPSTSRGPHGGRNDKTGVRLSFRLNCLGYICPCPLAEILLAFARTHLWNKTGLGWLALADALTTRDKRCKHGRFCPQELRQLGAHCQR